MALTRQGMKLRGYRFEGDKPCKAPRFSTLCWTFGEAFSGTELLDKAGFKAQGKPAHAVFTGDLIDAQGSPTHAAVDEVIAFFSNSLAIKTRHTA